ncbi:MAG: cysteine--tRNA ligase [Clostridia bacterium]|nr:cysteine--tRNA ligase [Clostridia bacterium]
MKIYNTLSGTKENFIPINGNKVNMYACGITVSGEAHIGHTYQALIYDIIRKFLIKEGFKVTYARNYTDVDDKIIAKSKEAGIPADIYAADMIKRIDKVMSDMRIDDPDIWLKATENIQNIIEFVSKLIEKGHAYATKKGDVYFSVESFPAYGRLSHRNLEDALNGVRIENDEEKRNPLDFALWKSAKEGEICWDSPWGKGRPGWHIECSAMNKEAFGEEIDLHGGGRDLIFPHHENEIAQTEALTGKRFVKYWVHNGLIKVNGQKMSKSLGNSLLMRDLLKEFSPETIKFALLQTNYRNDINITPELFPEAEKHVYEFYKVFVAAKEAKVAIEGDYPPIDESFNEAMRDDFNTALALSDLFAHFKKIKSLIAAKDKTAGAMLSQIRKTYSLLGLFDSDPEEFVKSYEAAHEKPVPENVLKLAEEMQAARLVKDYAKADALRAEITAAGYTVMVTKEGVKVKAAE